MNKLIVPSVAAIAVLGMLAGCGQKKAPDAGTPAAATATTPKAKGTDPTLAAEMPDATKPHPAPNVAHVATDFTGLKKADQTVGELFTDKAKWVGKPVAVRGKVVKVNRNIMDKTWVHLRDGTGEEGRNDVTVTAPGNVDVKEGDTALVKGTLAADKDLGMGYKYEVIIENATVTKE